MSPRFFFSDIADALGPVLGLLLLLAPVIVIAGALLLGRFTGRGGGEEDDGAPASLLSVTTVILAIVIVVLAIVAVSFLRARNISHQNACIGNLRQIDSAKEQWAMANQLADGDPINTASANEYIKGNTTPRCPRGGSYTYGAIGQDPDCNADSVTSHNFAG